MNPLDLWKKDMFLQHFQNRPGHIKIVSFDIFDTLIFRAVSLPADLFAIIGNQAANKGFMDISIQPEIFKDMRIKAERIARAKKEKDTGIREVSLKEIYNHMPIYMEDRVSIYNLEIEMEVEYCYLNPSVYSFIQHLGNIDVIIVLSSDMYLSREDIKRILKANGFDMALVKQIYISSEVNSSKSNGSLYKCLLDDYRWCNPDEILHIGDNLMSDIVKAKMYGLSTLHYDVIPNKAEYDLFERESLISEKGILPQLLSLRKLSVNLCSDYTKEDVFWFKTGTAVVGPILTCACEWLLDLATTHGINNIYTFMKGGKILAELLDEAIARKNINVTVCYLHISESSTYLPSLFTLTYDDINIYLKNKDLRVKDVFYMFKLEAYKNDFFDIWDIPTSDLGNRKGLKESLIEFLLRPDISEYILKCAKEERVNLDGYLDRFDFKNPFITFDIGYSGETAWNLDKIVKTIWGNENGIHSFIFGNPSLTDKVLKGLNARRYIEVNELSEIFPVTLAIEQMLTIMDCSVSCYTESKKKFEPIYYEPIVGEIQARYARLCQTGATVFHQLFLKTMGDKRYLIKRIIVDGQKDLPSMLKRLYCIPTYDEACQIGISENDNNFSFGLCRKPIKSNDIKSIYLKGVSKYLEDGVFNNDISWPYAAATLVDPNYLLKQLLNNNISTGNERHIFKIVGQLKRDRCKNVVIYGAGESGRRFYSILRLYGIDTVGFVDRNKYLQGNKVSGITVYSLNDAIQYLSNFPFVIGSFAYTFDIAQDIESACYNTGRKVRIYKIDSTFAYEKI